MKVEIIAVEYDFGHGTGRMGAGPRHLLKAGLPARLTEAGHQVEVRRFEPSASAAPTDIRTAFELAAAVADAARAALSGGGFPMVVSGNCGPAALGCVSAMQPSPAVFWFDAHADFNTPETSVSGFLDGMSLATLTGRCWPELAASISGFTPVAEEAVALVGARDLDAAEAIALAASKVRRVGIENLRRDLPPTLADPPHGRSTAYLHLDLDVLDPGEGIVNSYAAPGGLGRADVEWAMARIAEALRVEAGSLTALDPTSDPTGRACEAALTLGVALVNAVSRQRPS
jgi:arginase